MISSSVLIQFLYNVDARNSYCIICLRTSNERRLEQPKYLKKFLMSINQPYTYTDPTQLVCNICERQAAAAFRFREATNVAAQAHLYIRELQRSSVKRSYFGDKLMGIESPGNSHSKNLKNASLMMECETRLRKLRAQTQLLQTEVLVVGTPSTKKPGDIASNGFIAYSEEKDTEDFMLQKKPAVIASNGFIEYSEERDTEDYMEQFSTRPGESSDLYVVSDNVPRSQDTHVSDSLDPLVEPRIEIEPIFICDDVDPIGISNKESEVNIDTNTPRIDPTTPRKNNNILRADTSILRINTKKPRILPKTCQVVPINKLLNKPAAQEMSQLNEKAIIESSIVPPTNFLLHPIIFNSGMMTVPSLSANIIDGKIVTARNANIVMNTPQLAFRNGENLDIVTDPTKATSMLKRLSHQDTPKVHVFTTGSLQITSVETQSNSAANEIISLNRKSVNDSSKSANNHNYNTSIYKNSRKGHTKFVNDSVNVSRSNANNVLSTSNMQFCLVGESRSLAQLHPLGESSPLNESSSMGESCTLGESRPLGESPPLGRNEEAPAAQLRTDRIDWEDKIPMDVISFIDADENSSKRARRSAGWLPPPLGICNVTSLRQESQDDIIDLC